MWRRSTTIFPPTGTQWTARRHEQFEGGVQKNDLETTAGELIHILRDAVTFEPLRD
jgi:hypothetical protein